MLLSEVYTYLCVYDERNPHYINLDYLDYVPGVPRENCFCDNCFYGRDKLAMEIIRLVENKQ